MKLIAKKVESLGDWLKKYALQDTNGKIYGDMYINTSTKHGIFFTVNIRNPIHPDVIGECKTFTTQHTALVWARKQIENLPIPTIQDYIDLLEQIKEWRYEDMVSDDFAYSNGKIARWDRIELDVRKRMEKLK